MSRLGDIDSRWCQMLISLSLSVQKHNISVCSWTTLQGIIKSRHKIFSGKENIMCGQLILFRKRHKVDNEDIADWQHGSPLYCHPRLPSVILIYSWYQSKCLAARYAQAHTLKVARSRDIQIPNNETAKFPIDLLRDHHLQQNERLPSLRYPRL